MDNRDAKKVVQELSSKPFVCGEKFIEIDGGYVITTKEHFMHLESKVAGLTNPMKCGLWIPHDDYDICSACGFKCDNLCCLGDANFCPMCGAKMDGR